MRLKQTMNRRHLKKKKAISPGETLPAQPRRCWTSPLLAQTNAKPLRNFVAFRRRLDCSPCALMPLGVLHLLVELLLQHIFSAVPLSPQVALHYGTTE